MSDCKKRFQSLLDLAIQYSKFRQTVAQEALQHIQDEALQRLFALCTLQEREDLYQELCKEEFQDLYVCKRLCSR